MRVEDKDITKELHNLMEQVDRKYRHFREDAEEENMGTRLAVFYQLVRNGGEYDLKNQTGWKSDEFIFEGERIRNDAPGNILYGYLGKVFGFTDGLLCFAAGVAQYAAGTMVKNIKSFGDDPIDQHFIRKGIKIYNKKH